MQFSSLLPASHSDPLGERGGVPVQGSEPGSTGLSAALTLSEVLSKSSTPIPNQPVSSGSEVGTVVSVGSDKSYTTTGDGLHTNGLGTNSDDTNTDSNNNYKLADSGAGVPNRNAAASSSSDGNQVRDVGDLSSELTDAVFSSLRLADPKPLPHAQNQQSNQQLNQQNQTKKTSLAQRRGLPPNSSTNASAAIVNASGNKAKTTNQCASMNLDNRSINFGQSLINLDGGESDVASTSASTTLNQAPSLVSLNQAPSVESISIGSQALLPSKVADSNIVSTGSGGCFPAVIQSLGQSSSVGESSVRREDGRLSCGKMEDCHLSREQSPACTSPGLKRCSGSPQRIERIVIGKFLNRA